MGSLIMTEEEKEAIRVVMGVRSPWFKCETGFRFRDSDGDECVVIGFGGWRRTEYKKCCHRSEPTLHLEMCKPTLVGSYLYKGEWHMIDVVEMTDIMPSVEPCGAKEKVQCSDCAGSGWTLGPAGMGTPCGCTGKGEE